MSIHSVDDVLRLRNGAFIAQRLRWIDDRLHWHDGFTRSDLIQRFGISPQQASADIAMYLGLADHNAAVNTSTKGYVKLASFVPLFPKNPFRWMSDAVESGDRSVIPCESLTLPSRRVDDEVMTALMAGFASRQAVSISYQSLTTADVTRRLICPHNVVDTGDRVHVRAWDDRRRLFSDFVLGRILRAELDLEYPWVDAIADTSWNETIEVVLAPDRGLSASQKAAIKREFQMKDGRAAIPVRKALLVYFLGRLGLLEAVRRGDSSPDVSRGISCLNPHDLRPILPAPALARTKLERAQRGQAG
jgi:hypothetical protein